MSTLSRHDPNHMQEAETERVAQGMVCATVEKLATDLATYLAAGVHQPAENGRQAVVLFLEGMAAAPLDHKSEGCDRDEAMARALLRIGEIVIRIRTAARL